MSNIENHNENNYEKRANNKRLKVDNSEEKLHIFLDWCSANNLNISDKVRIGQKGSCAQYGMVATESIECDEVLFEIPRKLLLHQHTTDIHNILADPSLIGSSTSGWAPTVLSLMYETCKENSLWKPYLDLVPDYDQLDLPMFWSQSEQDTLLAGTNVLEFLEKDKIGMEKEFNDIILPFIKKHNTFFPSPCDQIENYRRIVAFVMAYSFTEPTDDDDDDDDDTSESDAETVPNIPMMVPVADILNHIAKNNAHLDFGVDTLKMVATQDISAGEEVYNTYGDSSNCCLLHMYGFSERHPNNHYDTVEFNLSDIQSWSKHEDCTTLIDQSTLDDKWKHLELMEITHDGFTYVLGIDGFLTELEIAKTLKVLCMSPEEFSDYQQADSDGDDDGGGGDNDMEMTFDDIENCPQEWRSLLHHYTRQRIATYNQTVDELRAMLKDHDAASQMKSRRKWSAYCAHSQLELLHKLLEKVAK